MLDLNADQEVALVAARRKLLATMKGITKQREEARTANLTSRACVLAPN